MCIGPADRRFGAYRLGGRVSIILGVILLPKKQGEEPKGPGGTRLLVLGCLCMTRVGQGVGCYRFPRIPDCVPFSTTDHLLPG